MKKSPGTLQKSKGDKTKNQKQGGETEYDHFLDVYERYPEDAYRTLLPHLYEIELLQN